MVIFFLVNIDAIRIIIERIINNKSPFSGDNNHLHHLFSKKISKKFVFIPYLFFSVIPFSVYSIFEIKTYIILIFSLIFYFLLYVYLKKIKNA